ncbi:hypothetical protein [Chloroflexus sp. Y-396-1]|uniref:hypothetical protein n=1 Tax=Chloroflexus sp. Y-396-1 TaxID=867845 RepID=UPI0004B9D66D|nr:hypothetical protein [Chloroflexus sp. Y-396-1]
MGYDLYVENPEGDEVTRLRLLVTNGTPLSDYLSLIHGQFDKKTQQLTRRGDFNQYIDRQLRLLQSLGLNPPSLPNMAALPPGSWFLQFTFTLARPWISKDDAPFYVTESVNPVRKDKVFKVPTMSAASWKGLLRWTVMHTRLALPKDKRTADEFAQERLAQTLLFGDEKGEEPGQTKDFAAYLDALKLEARQDYEHLLRAHYKLSSDNPLPHHSGRLIFYPTFFNLIDVEVINPHSRKTRAGTHPIYLECVPIGAQGTFSLLYVPLDLIGKKESDIRQQALADLKLITEGLSAMFLTYGFSAKRTSGYGVAEDKIVKGEVKTRIGRHDLTGKNLSELPQEVKNVSFV